MQVLAFLLVAVIFFLGSLAVKVEIDFRYRRKEDLVEIDLRAFKGLWHVQYQRPAVQLSWEKDSQVEVERGAKAQENQDQATKKRRPSNDRQGWLSRFWPKIPNYLRSLKVLKQQFYKGIHCKRVRWRIEVGFMDAAHTALAAGNLWAALGSSFARLNRQVTMEEESPELLVVPQFEKPGFLCDLQCIFQVRIGHIIFIGWKAWQAFRRA